MFYFLTLNCSILVEQSSHLYLHLNVLFSFKQCLVVKDLLTVKKKKPFLDVPSQLEQRITYVHFHIVEKVV